MSWTTPDDVTDAWIGGTPPDDDTQLQLWIDKAERQIRAEVPDLQTRLDADAELIPPSTELLNDTIDVVVAMVTRVFRNPLGIRNQNSTTGPFTSTVTFGGETPGELTLTSKELAKLEGEQTEGTAYTVSMIPVTSRYSPDYVEATTW